MKNIMRAISLGLVCAIATSNVAQANQTNEKSPTKWEITKAVGCAIAALPVYLISRAFDKERGIFSGGVCGTGLLVAGGMLLRKPSALVRAEVSREALHQVKGRTSCAATLEQLIKEADQVVERETIFWKDRKRMAFPVFAAGLTFFGISYEQYKDSQSGKKIARHCIDCLVSENREMAQKITQLRDLYGNTIIRLCECKQKQNVCNKCKDA